MVQDVVYWPSLLSSLYLAFSLAQFISYLKPVIRPTYKAPDNQMEM